MDPNKQARVEVLSFRVQVSSGSVGIFFGIHSGGGGI